MIALLDGLALQRALAGGDLDVASIFEDYVRWLSLTRIA
jgi:hypothetical protein